MRISAMIIICFSPMFPPTADRSPSPIVIDERRAVEIVSKMTMVRETFPHPAFRAHENASEWRILVRHEGVNAFGSDRIIYIDKRTGQVTRIVYGK